MTAVAEIEAFQIPPQLENGAEVNPTDPAVPVNFEVAGTETGVQALPSVGGSLM